MWSCKIKEFPSFFFFKNNNNNEYPMLIFFKLPFTYQLGRVWSVLIKQRIVSFFLDSPFGGIKSQSMRLCESFVRSRSKLWYELFTRVICTGKTHRYAIQIIFTFCEMFIKEHYVKEMKIFFRPSLVRAVSLKSMIVCICSGF